MAEVWGLAGPRYIYPPYRQASSRPQHRAMPTQRTNGGTVVWMDMQMSETRNILHMAKHVGQGRDPSESLRLIGAGKGPCDGPQNGVMVLSFHPTIEIAAYCGFLVASGRRHGGSLVEALLDKSSGTLVGCGTEFSTV